MTMIKATLRSSLMAAAAAGLCTFNGGCGLLFGGDGDGAFLEGDDVWIAIPSGIADRAGDENMIRGDIYDIVDRTITDTNGWVTGGVEGIAKIYAALDRVRETSTDGTWRVYGPYEDDKGRDLSWLARLDEVEGSKNFEFYVGPRDAKSIDDLELLMDGSLEVDGDDRSGGFSLHFDTIEANPAMKDEKDSLHTFGGSILVSFERDVTTLHKEIVVKFDDFQVLYQGYLDDDTFFSDESYSYRSTEDGSGDFHLSLYGQWDDWGWSGPETEKFVLDMAWNEEGEGRARGQILEIDGVGDLKHGDLIIDECFAPEGWLSWRAINDTYVDEVPEYNFGDETSCVLGVEALPL